MGNVLRSWSIRRNEFRLSIERENGLVYDLSLEWTVSLAVRFPYEVWLGPFLQEVSIVGYPPS